MTTRNHHRHAGIRVWLQQDLRGPLRPFCEANRELLVPAARPDEADAILYDTDIPQQVVVTPEFRRWPEKCVVVSEIDHPTYFLPACYSSNRRSPLAHGRTETIPFVLSQLALPNAGLRPDWSRRSRPYLYAFLGGSTSWVRKRLFRHPPRRPDVLIEATDAYQHWNHAESLRDWKRRHQERYAQVVRDSWFFLCPRGAGVSSIRLFEVMQAGTVPVVLSDRWIPPADIPWNEFALFVPERDLPHLDAIIRAHAAAAPAMAARARLAWEQHCNPHGSGAETLARSLRRIQQGRDEGRERRIRRVFPIIAACRRVRTTSRQAARGTILGVFSLAGRPFPFQLNRPLPMRR